VPNDAESWLRYHARAGWRERQDEDSGGREVLTFEFSGPLDAMDFWMRPVAAEHRGARR
jgi:hypothetical protein